MKFCNEHQEREQADIEKRLGAFYEAKYGKFEHHQAPQEVKLTSEQRQQESQALSDGFFRAQQRESAELLAKVGQSMAARNTKPR